MSTYGTAVVVDCPPNGSAPIAAALSELAPGEADVYLKHDDASVRVSAYLPGVIETLPRVSEALAHARNGRAAIAEDADEFGAMWAVLACADGEVEIVHRRYVLNADPFAEGEVTLAIEALEHDPRVHDVAGPEAARRAAELFGTNPAAMIEAEESAGSAWEELGLIGGPFPWWDALALEWPGPDSGVSFATKPT